MKIVYLSYERNINIDPNVYITDIDEIDKCGLVQAVKKIKEFNPDYIIEREFNDSKAFYDKLYLALPEYKKVFWAIDTHMNFERYVRYSRYFDFVFCAISNHVSKLQEQIDIPVKWLPLYFPAQILPIKKEKKYDISFVGNFKPHFFEERRKYLDFLKKEYGDQFHCVTDYKNMSSIMNNSKISFNHSLRDDLNFRVFEALGYGSHLITDVVSDMLKIKNLSNFVTVYKDFEILKKHIDFLLDTKNYGFYLDDSQNFIKDSHCLKHRINSLIEMIKTNEQGEF